MHYKNVKTLILALLILPVGLSAQSPKVELLAFRTASLCDIEGTNCLTTFSDVRMLKITKPKGGATAYQIQIITSDRDGAKRTWSYVVERAEHRVGEFSAHATATFFVIPISLDIPILDVWVTALVPSGEPAHQLL